MNANKITPASCHNFSRASNQVYPVNRQQHGTRFSMPEKFTAIIVIIKMIAINFFVWHRKAAVVRVLAAELRYVYNVRIVHSGCVCRVIGAPDDVLCAVNIIQCWKGAKI